MKILQLGAGMMGRGGIKVLQYFEGIEKVTVADINLELAQEFADSLNFPETDAIELDAKDTEKLKEVAKDYDIVFSTVGPYTEIGGPILEAVIEAGTNYVDVCDDDDATLEFLGYDEKAKKAGVTALIGCGQTPGTANVQAKYLAEMVDSVHSIEIAWATDIPNFGDAEEGETYYFETPEQFMEESPAGWNHMVHGATGDITVWRDGKYVDVEQI